MGRTPTLSAASTSARAAVRAAAATAGCYRRSRAAILAHGRHRSVSSCIATNGDKRSDGTRSGILAQNWPNGVCVPRSVFCERVDNYVAYTFI